MMRRSPSKKGEADAGAAATAVGQGEAAASPFELAQVSAHNRHSNNAFCMQVLKTATAKDWHY